MRLISLDTVAVETLALRAISRISIGFFAIRKSNLREPYYHSAQVRPEFWAQAEQTFSKKLTLRKPVIGGQNRVCPATVSRLHLPFSKNWSSRHCYSVEACGDLPDHTPRLRFPSQCALSSPRL